MTSRSPRSPRETPRESGDSFSTVEEAQQHLHKAIYAHATEDWYHRDASRQRRSLDDGEENWDDQEGEFEDDDELLELD